MRRLLLALLACTNIAWGPWSPVGDMQSFGGTVAFFSESGVPSGNVDWSGRNQSDSTGPVLVNDDLQVGASNAFIVDGRLKLQAPSSATARLTDSTTNPAKLQLGSFAQLVSTSDGVFLLQNAAGTGFTDLFLGTADGSGIRLRKSGIQLQISDGNGNGTSMTVLEMRTGGTTNLAYATTASGGGSTWGSGGKYCFSSNASGTSGTADTCSARGAAGTWRVEGAAAAAGKLQFGTACTILTGAGDPEGVVTGSVCDLYLRTDGSTNTTLCVKTSGTGNTGWTCK